MTVLAAAGRRAKMVLGPQEYRSTLIAHSGNPSVYAGVAIENKAIGRWLGFNEEDLKAKGLVGEDVSSRLIEDRDFGFGVATWGPAPEGPQLLGEHFFDETNNEIRSLERPVRAFQDFVRRRLNLYGQ